jgi:effector-binding domain-containing protein
MHFDLHTDPAGWRWQLALPAPEGVGADAVTAARVDERVRLVHRAEQRVARLVHHGPYDDEQPSLDALYAFVDASGLTPAGPHTEVYLTDPSTTPPAQLRTLLQVPVSRWV